MLSYCCDGTFMCRAPCKCTHTFHTAAGGGVGPRDADPTHKPHMLEGRCKETQQHLQDVVHGALRKLEHLR